MTGLWLENGPFRLSPTRRTGSSKIHVTLDPYSWHKLPAWVLYIDQPVGTGFSFTTTGKGYPTNDLELNQDFYFFIQQFLHLHADKFLERGDEATDLTKRQRMRRPFYLSGESHAGHYNSIYTNYILQQNQINSGSIYIPIRGAAIGNGWVDPYWQYAGAQAAYGLGLIGIAEMAALDAEEQQCRGHLDRQEFNVDICYRLIDSIVDQATAKNTPWTMNSYDIRTRQSRTGPRTYPPGREVVEAYLGGHGLGKNDEMPPNIYLDVLKAIHATPSLDAGLVYSECSRKPHEALIHLDGQGVVEDIVAILEHTDNVELLFFNGMYDLVCNHVGNERSLDNMPWQYQKEWNQAKRYAWTASVDKKQKKISGYLREHRNLKYLKLADAGHMVGIHKKDIVVAQQCSWPYLLLLFFLRYAWTGSH